MATVRCFNKSHEEEMLKQGQPSWLSLFLGLIHYPQKQYPRSIGAWPLRQARLAKLD